MKNLWVVLLCFFLVSCVPVNQYQIQYEKGYKAGKQEALATSEEAKKEACQEGYSCGFKEGAASCNLCLRKPTYKEVLAFLKEDDTDQLVGVNCIVFTTRLNDNAIAKGLWCYVVVFNWSSGDRSGFHAINAFDTMDEGLVYVEPMTDDIVELELGKDYGKNFCDNPKSKFCPLYPMFVRQIGLMR